MSASCTIFAGTCGDLCELVGNVDRLAVVVVAVAGDEHLGLDLAEATTPASSRKRWNRPTSALSTSQLSLRLTLSSPRKTMASLDPLCLRRFSAKFSRAFGKNYAPGIMSASLRSGPLPCHLKLL